MNHCITWWTSFNPISTFVCHVTRISTFSTTNKSTPICITMSGISLIFCICTIYTRKRIEIEMSDNDVINDLLIFALRSFCFPLVNWISNIIFFIGHSRYIKNQQKYKKPIKVYTNYSLRYSRRTKRSAAWMILWITFGPKWSILWSICSGLPITKINRSIHGATVLLFDS